MRGKVILWLANFIVIIVAAINGRYALGLAPLAAGLLMLGVYSSYLALTAAQRSRLIAKRADLASLPADVRPFLSILVAAKNEERVIASTIERLLRLDYRDEDGPRFEVVVVDDASTDGTFAILGQLVAQNPGLKVLRRDPSAIPGKSAALNDALPLARGEIIAVFDADARVAPDFLTRALPRLLVPGVGAVQVQKRISNARQFKCGGTPGLACWFRRSTLLPLFQDLEMLMDTAYQTARGHGRGAVDLRGNGLLVKRDALVDVGGWNNETLTDDLDLSTRLHAAGWQVAFCPEAVVWEEGVLTWSALFRQRHRWVEGCIRRYLDYGGQLLSADIPLAVKADAFLFALEFVFPMWLFFGGSLWLTARLAGVAYDPGVCIAIALGNVAVTLPFLLSATWHHVTRNPLLVPLVLLAVGVYLLHWLPVIIWTTLRLVALKPQRSWAKTEHVGEVG